MRSLLRIILVAVACVAVAVGAAVWLGNVGAPAGLRGRDGASNQNADRTGKTSPAATIDQEDQARRTEIFVDNSLLEDGGLTAAFQYTRAVPDPSSLHDLRSALEERGRLGIAAVEAEIARLKLGPSSTSKQARYGLDLHHHLAQLLMYEGRLDEAAKQLDLALELGGQAEIPPHQRADLLATRGIVAFRQGEIANCIGCVGPSSCIFPITGDAVHTDQTGSREAIKLFMGYLQEWPGDLRIRWLLNLAHATLGEYPQKVPARFLVPIDSFRSPARIARFDNVALAAGLTTRGPSQAGGSIFDDFTGDGLPDLLTTSLDADRGASFYVNQGDGTFAEHSSAAGLDDQIYALNITRADFDNDGHLDVLMLRGAWEKPMRMSLLRNTGKNTFEDVTIAAGLEEPISSEAAAWGDYDNDGLLDLFVCGEYIPPVGDPAPGQFDPRNQCRLYHNEGKGKFREVSKSAGIVELICGKGAAWGDYDGDGLLDLFVSNMRGPCSLYHNEGGGKFREVASELGVSGPDRSFACWFWDFDNDGKLDLFINDYSTSLAEAVAIAMNIPLQRSIRPRLYRNEGSGGFRDVTKETGLDRAMAPMGCNFGDIDNDGFLDIYQGTGGMSYEYLVPDLLFRNVEGKRFEDVTMASATGHLQKGHGVSFADYDLDGDLDLFVELGGAVPGDRSYDALFRNPCQRRHWLAVKLIGTRTNSAAIGAQIHARVKSPDGGMRSIHRTVGNNSSFGGNSLVEHIGLLDAASVAELEVTWPTSKTTQRFQDIPADQRIIITEGVNSLRSWARPEGP